MPNTFTKAQRLEIAADLRRALDFACRDHETNGPSHKTPYYSLGAIQSIVARAIGTLETGSSRAYIEYPTAAAATVRCAGDLFEVRRAVLHAPAIAGGHTE